MSDASAVENFGKALLKLREFTATAIVDDRDRAGIIQAFAFTFEQCWRSFQQIAMTQGIATASPRQALEAAVRLKLIRREDENAWLDMLRDRNMTSHLYQEMAALEIVQRVMDRYLTLLDEAYQGCG
jgi:nucleotidyltransferase substrate binding protein (TIGR01987 family)